MFDELDSSVLIPFSANGSGDFDSACFTFPADGTWHCAESEPAAGSEFLQIDWSSNLDGRLTPEDDDWLTFETRLSAGIHEITLTLSDGINPNVSTTRTSLLPNLHQFLFLIHLQTEANLLRAIPLLLMLETVLITMMTHSR